MAPATKPPVAPDPLSEERRQLLRRALLLAAYSSIGGASAARAEPESSAGGSPGGHIRFDVIEPHSLLDLRVVLAGFDVRRRRLFSSERVLIERKPGSGRMLVEFPPQHIHEQIFSETSAAEAPPETGTVRGVFSNPTKLLFAVRAKRSSPRPIPLSLAGLLDWGSTFEWIDPNDASKLVFGAEPAIELPSGLLLALPGATWDARQAAAGAPAAELWTARATSGEAGSITIIPFATTAIRRRPGLKEFAGPLSDDDRSGIVAAFGPVRTPCTAPTPPRARHLALSSIGGWLHVRARHPDPPSGCGVSGWEQQVSFGRDQAVRVERTGFLYPHGIKVRLVKRTERRMQVPPGGAAAGAVLRAEMVIERVSDDAVSNDVLDMPLRKLELNVARTPPLDANTTDTDLEPKAESLINGDKQIFWPFVGGKPYRFPLKARDRAGDSVAGVAVAAIFVSNKRLEPDGTMSPKLLAEIDKAWEVGAGGAGAVPAGVTGVGTPDLRRIDLAGQCIALAKGISPGDTSLAIKTIELVRGATLSAEEVKRAGRPFMARAYRCLVAHPAVTALTGEAKWLEATYKDLSSISPGELTPEIERAKGKVLDPLSLQAGQYLQLVNDAKLEFVKYGAQRLGAVAAPGVLISGLSATRGLLSKAEVELQHQAADARLELGRIFEGVEAKLLGGLLLSELLRSVKVARDAIASVPKLDYRLPDLDLTKPLPQVPKEVSASYRWNYQWAQNADAVRWFNPKLTRQLSPPDNEPPAEIELNGEVTVALGTGAPRATASGRLSNFEVCFPSEGNPWIVVGFKRIDFSASQGRTDFRPVVAGFDFRGEFSFLSDIKKAMERLLGPLKGDGIEITPDHAGLSRTLALGGFSIGPIQVTALRLAYGVTIPFDGSPLLALVGLNSRSDPFLVSVNGYAGAGFVRLHLSVEGVKALEVAIEFGGSWNLSLWVAHGRLTVMAGIYYAQKGQEVKLQGYVRAAGHIGVLIIGGVSIVAFIGLTYKSDGSAQGQAWVEVSARFGFVSVTQSFALEHRVGGGSGKRLATSVADSKAQGPEKYTRFSDVFDPNPRSEDSWESYWAAFQFPNS